MGLLDAAVQYIRDAMPGGLLSAELGSSSLDRVAERAGRNLQDVTGITARDKRRAWKRGLLDAVTGSDDTMGSLNRQAYEGAMNAASLAPVGIVRNQELANAARNHFGRTFSPSETGYLLDDGTRLDLSGRHYASGYVRHGDKFVPAPGKPDYLSGGRNVDHRELGDLVPGQGWDGLADFLNQSGAVRYMPNTGISVVDTNMPSQAQITKAVQDFRRSNTAMNVDVDSLNGNSRASMEFDRPTVDAVLEWIRSHMKPEAFK